MTAPTLIPPDPVHYPLPGDRVRIGDRYGYVDRVEQPAPVAWVRMDTGEVEFFAAARCEPVVVDLTGGTEL